jgi:hypothetical protein
MGLLNRIKWIKNVKRENGTGWAYMEDQEKEGFVLAFSPAHAGGASKPKKGDVIVIFQTRYDENTQTNGTYLTHLVIVDSKKTKPTDRDDYPTGRHVIVLARANPENSLKSTEINLSFEDVNTGQLCNFDRFNKTQTPADNRRAILDLFNPFF